MIRGLYTAGWSMTVENKKIDLISNNIANANTTGYKKDSMLYGSFEDTLTKRINDTRSQTNSSANVGYMQLGYDVSEVYTNYTQGQIVDTGDKMDVAFQEPASAFFTVNVPDANGNNRTMYTRDGSFTIGSDGRLVTKGGHLVLGEKGPITLIGNEFKISPDGTISQNDNIVDKLRIADFTDTKILRKQGANLVMPEGQPQLRPFTGRVAQGFLEQSNVDTIKEMVDMISVMRAYESNQKVIQAHDNTLQKAVNEVGAIR